MREFNKIRDYSILELTNYIVKEFHIPLRKDLKDLEFHVKNIPDNKNFKEDISLAKEVFKQFKTEITKHIDDEENCFFKEAVALEKNEIKDLYQVKKFLVVQETEHNEIDNYLVGLRNIINNLVDHKFDKLDELEKIIEKILTDTIDHINIEDNYLNTAVYKLIKEKDNNS